MVFFNFFCKNTPNIISELNDDFSEDFFEVLHISVGQNAKPLLKSSNFELQNCYAPQNNPQKNRHKSHVEHKFLRCPRAEIAGGAKLSPPPVHG